MKNVHQRRVKRRTLLLTFLTLIWLSVILLRLADLQVVHHSRLKAYVQGQNQNTQTIYPQRGTIFDRAGCILARSLPKPSIYYRPLPEESTATQKMRIRRLQELLGLPESRINDILSRIEKEDPFIWIKRKVDVDEAAALGRLNLPGIGTMEENKRFYPEGKLAAHLIGRVDIDDRGISGLEYEYNDVLQGQEGKLIILKDAKLREYEFEILKEPIPGKDLMLTIDETIQYIAEKELAEACRRFQADWGTVILSDPKNGEIWAMASHPSFDLNHPPSTIRNNAIHHTFAPGSTFKIVTASAALESRKIGLDDHFDCSDGFVSLPGMIVKDHKKFGVLSFPQVIINSSNVGVIQLAQRIGNENFFRMIKTFGLGQKTGIDLPGEEMGIVRPYKNWTVHSLPALSMGYEINVTPIQMLQVINTIANQGVMVPPRILKRILDEAVSPRRAPEKRRAISRQTAQSLAKILQMVVEEGTGQAAKIEGYTVVGKTGTAQKIDPMTRSYSSKAHVASFVGYIQTEDHPVFSMIVVIDSPKGYYYGSQVAAPLFKRIAALVLRRLGYPKKTRPEDKLVIAQHRRQNLP